MTSIILETIICDLCHGTEFVEELTGLDWEYGSSTTFRVSKCKQCNLIQLNPRPDGESIKYIYPNSYGYYEDQGVKGRVNRFIKSAVHKFSAKPLQLEHLDVIKKGGILDVGCGTGSTLYPYGFYGSLLNLANRGWNACGCEISENAAGIGMKSGLKIQVGRLLEVSFEDNYFDVVRFNHVLEHSTSPLDDLEKAKQLLKSNGLLILSVPNIDSAAYHLFGKCWSGLDLPRHFYFFTPEILRKYFDQLGFEVVADCTDSNVEDFSHSLKHFLHSSLFNKKNLSCANNNKLNEIYKSKSKARVLLALGLNPIVNYFNSRRLGDNYTVICKKR